MIAILINAPYGICQRNSCVRATPRRCEWASSVGLDYVNRIDCLQAKLRMAEINSIRNRKARKLHASKKYVRLLNERNIRRRKMNGNVISVRESNEKYDRSAEYGTYSARRVVFCEDWKFQA